MLERNLWQQLQRVLKQDKWPYVRIEATAAGIPDVLVSDSDGQLHLIELKMVKGSKIKLSPHQVSFLTRFSKTGASVWILARREGVMPSHYLFYGDAAIALAEGSLDQAGALTPVVLEGGTNLPWTSIKRALHSKVKL
jgi:Holliday junction resolvase